MDQYKWIADAIKVLGFPICICIYLLWERRKEHLEDLTEKEEELRTKKAIDEKKSNGTYISYKTVEENSANIRDLQRTVGALKEMVNENRSQTERNTDHIKYNSTKLSDWLVKEEEENVMFAEIRKDQAFLQERFEGLKEIFEKLEANQKDCFTLIAGIKDRLLDKR